MMKEALATEKIFAYVFLKSGDGKRVPSAVWSTAHGDHIFENGQIDIPTSEREPVLKCWLRFDEIRNYFAERETTPQYPLLSLEQASAPFVLPKGAAPPHRPTRAGRPTVYMWAAISAEAARFIIENDLPETQAKLEAHLAEWYAAEYGHEPGDHTFREFVSYLFKRRSATKSRQ
jgi:hypothetical protein